MGVARNLHPDWEGWQIIDGYKETYGEIPWNFKIDVPQLTQLVKDFYQQTFYKRFKIDEISNGSLQETTEWEFKVANKIKPLHLKSFLTGVLIVEYGEPGVFNVY